MAGSRASNRCPFYDPTMTGAEEILATSEFKPKQEDLVFNFPPSFESVDAERQHRKERLAGVLRGIGGMGFAHWDDLMAAGTNVLD